MDFCSNCGGTTDPDWVFCRTCGSGLDLPEAPPIAPPAATDSASPKVELISRGWDALDVDQENGPLDPLDSDVIDLPLPPGAVEVAVGDIAIVETTPAPHPLPHDAVTNDITEAVPPIDETDGWDHLRPHGEVPPLLRRSKAPARFAQMTTLLFSLSAVVAAMVHFYLNTQLDSFASGQVSATAIGDLNTVAEVSLLVTAGLAVIALATLAWWMIIRHKTVSLRPGPSGAIAPIGVIAGGSLIGVFYAMDKDTVAEALTANSFIILGLGFLMMAGLAAVRTLGRIEHTDAK